MGYPLRSNIFQSGTGEQDYFAGFPIQVAVLFSPTNRQFADSFREVFLKLDHLTGKHVVFFAILDPPADWIEAARGRDWPQNFRTAFDASGFSVDDRALVREIARLFGVAWDCLPSIVVGTNLWTGEFITSATTIDEIEHQLAVLTDLARRQGRPEIREIADVLRGSFKFHLEVFFSNADSQASGFSENPCRHRRPRALNNRLPDNSSSVACYGSGINLNTFPSFLAASSRALRSASAWARA
jgi:hypothetical protein